jgi:hypothetical protein
MLLLVMMPFGLELLLLAKLRKGQDQMDYPQFIIKFWPIGLPNHILVMQHSQV